MILVMQAKRQKENLFTSMSHDKLKWFICRFRL